MIARNQKTTNVHCLDKPSEHTKGETKNLLSALELGGNEKTSARNLFALRNLVDYVSLNVHELYSLTGTGDLAIAVEKLYTLLEPRAMFIKAGEKGSFVYNGKDLIEIPSCRVSSVDPTGCGDAFNAGVIYGVLRKLDLSKAALIGNIMSAYKVLGLGARHLPRSVMI
ncbi:MAG: PfkB family carbohydrate kinase [Desulfurococcaceae archaeon]